VLPREGCAGLRPQDLLSAYDLPWIVPNAQTIAIVAANDDPRIQHDLAVYDAELAVAPCTVAEGCLTKLNGAGKKHPLPPPTVESARETSLDVEIAHAICQGCRIVLVEASSTSLADVEEAVHSAVSVAAATEVSISLGEAEPPTAPHAGAAFDHPGVVITAAAGDSGYLNWGSEEAERGLAEYPASAPGVIAVGGTRLTLGPSGERAEETLWAGSGSGCSRLFGAPAWQRALAGWPSVGCGTSRSVADISADADPHTGVIVYDSFKNAEGFAPKWHRVGGTSLSAPLVAAAFALAGGANGVAYPAQTLYANAERHPSWLHDIVGGSNGECKLVQQECTVAEEEAGCSGGPMCLAGLGYDGPSGLGSLAGIAALAVHRDQQIAFHSSPPSGATVGGPSYTLIAYASSRLPIAFSSATPAVCQLEGALVRFLAAGTCTVNASQQGNAEWEPAPETQQSFAVAAAPKPPGAKSGVLEFTSSVPPPVTLPGLHLRLSGAPSADSRNGAVSFVLALEGSGELRWLLTYANGSYGVVQGHAGSCGSGRVKLHGGCRPARATYAAGHLPAGTGRVVHLVVRPSHGAAVALARARAAHHGLPVEMVLLYRSASAGAAAAKITRTLTVRLR
jgi:hypothetical protein